MFLFSLHVWADFFLQNHQLFWPFVPLDMFVSNCIKLFQSGWKSTSAMIPSNSSSVKSSSISKRMPWGKLLKRIHGTAIGYNHVDDNITGSYDERGRVGMIFYLLRSPEMCHLLWTPAHLRQKACNQKYELAFQRDRTGAQELLNWFKISQIMTTSLQNKSTEED